MIRTTSLSTARPGHLIRLTASAVLVGAAWLAGSPASAQPQPGMQPSGPQHASMHRGHGLHGGMPMFPERALDAVGATADQKAKLREIFKSAGDDVRAQHESGRALHQQMLQLMAAPQVDAAAAEALRQKQLAQHDAVSKRMLQAMLDAQAVLTPEQRAKLAERMSERQRQMQQRMERHQHGGPAAPRG